MGRTSTFIRLLAILLAAALTASGCGGDDGDGGESSAGSSDVDSPGSGSTEAESGDDGSSDHGASESGSFSASGDARTGDARPSTPGTSGGDSRGSRSAGSGDESALPASAADLVDRYFLSAFGLALVEADGAIEIDVSGQRSYDDETPVGADARWHLGSETKVMTAVLLATLVDAGELGWDDEVVDLLPDADVDPELVDVTLRDLLDHRSGIDPFLDLVDLHEMADTAAARRHVVSVSLGPPDAIVGEFHYSNANYVVAGAVAERTVGAAWEDLLVDRVFRPLGMDSCGFGAPSGDGDPLGHDHGQPLDESVQYRDNPPAMAPAGAVHCNLEDWARFVAELLAITAGDDSDLISSATARSMLPGTSDYEAGLGRTFAQDAEVFTHDGSNTFWYARFVVVPERGRALLMTTNSAGVDAEGAMNEVTDLFLHG